MFRRIAPRLVLTFAVSIAPAAPGLAHAQEARDFGGKFASVVFQVLGESKAREQTSFAMASIALPTGALERIEGVSLDQSVYPASSIKTLIALTVLRQADAQTLDLDQKVTISQSNADAECAGYGCQIYGYGRVLSIRKLLWDMITISNNIATNQLIDLAGKDPINATADALGAPSLRVVRKVYNVVNPEPGNPDHNRATARGMVELYREIVSGRLGLLSVQNRELLIQILGNQTDNNRLNALFPPRVHFFHKTGSTSATSSDAGFFWHLLENLGGLPGNPDPKEAIILVGLQNFRDFTPLQTIGRRAYEIAISK